MKHMDSWRGLAKGLGIALVIAGVLLIIMGQLLTGIFVILASFGLFLTSAVCAWMDDLLEEIRSIRRNADALNDRTRELEKEKSKEQRKAQKQQEEPEKLSKQDEIKPQAAEQDETMDVYQRARRSRYEHLDEN